MIKKKYNKESVALMVQEREQLYLRGCNMSQVVFTVRNVVTSAIKERCVRKLPAGMAGLIDLAFGMVEGGEGALKYSVTNEGYRKEAR